MFFGGEVSRGKMVGFKGNGFHCIVSLFPGGLNQTNPQLAALSHPFFLGEGSPTKIDYREKGTLF